MTTRATGGVKDDSSDHGRAVVVRWTQVCHVHLLRPNLIHRRNRQFMMMSTAIRIPAKLPRDVAIAVAETSKESASSFGNLCRETMKGRGRSAEITARCRIISFSQERSRRLGDAESEIAPSCGSRGILPIPPAPAVFDQSVIAVRALWQDYVGEGGPESAGNVSHGHRGATVSGHAHTTDQRGHVPKEVNICPKKDDVALWAVISLGYDSPRTLTASEAGT